MFVIASWIAACVCCVALWMSLPIFAVIAAFAAVGISRYLFFVSVVPLSMGLTFLKGGAAAGGVAA